MIDRQCNICGSRDLVPRGDRGNHICGECHSDGRTRLLWLILETRRLVRPGLRCLHIAPEAALAPRLHALLGEGYEPVDASPDLFPFVPGIRRLDLVAEAASLPSEHYDLVLHSHVMEHVRGNVTAILFHLHRSLKANGRQVCCIPIMRDQHYAEDLSPLPPEEATRRFGQDDHVRQFGTHDLEATLGMIFALPTGYDLLADHEASALTRHAIPERAWSGWSANSVLVLEKRDLLLRS